MKKVKIIGALSLLAALLVSVVSLKANEKTPDFKPRPAVVRQFLEEVKKNENWKTAFLTGTEEQIVFMNISPQTNPYNEIGEEVHPFDQVIFIVEGNAKAIIDGDSSSVTEGDLIFIPKGTNHNVVNVNEKKPLKLVSFYSENDIPKDAVYKRKAD